LYENLDRNLVSGMQFLEADRRLPEEGQARLRYLMQELHEHQNLLCVMYSTGGTVLERTEALAADSIPTAPELRDQRQLIDMTLPIIGQQRALAAKTKLGDNDVTLLLLTPLAELDHQLRQLVTATISAIPVALLFAGGVSYLMARRALAPVNRLRAKTEQITA